MKNIGRAESPALVFLLTLLVFWPCLHFDFVRYDDLLLLQTPGRGLDWSSLRWILTHAPQGNYTPLSALSYALDTAFWGESAFGYHLTNLLLHAANAALFCLLAAELLSQGGVCAEEMRPAAFISALLFSLHPLRIQSVAWIAERRDVLCGLFFLLSLLCWVQGRARERPTPAWRMAALAAFVCALLSKASALPLPAALLLIDAGLYRKLRGWREYTPFFLLSAAFGILTLLAQWRYGALVDTAAAPLTARLGQAAIGAVYYLGKALWPADLGIYEWHSWEAVRTATWLGGAATAGLLIAARMQPALQRPVLAALLFQTVMLLPVLGLVTYGHEIVADRYSYLSGLGWAVLAGAGLIWLTRGRRLASVALAGAVVAVLTVSTRAQLPAWRDAQSLWRTVLRVDPFSLVARRSLALALFEQGRDTDAFNYLEDQVTAFPKDDASREYLARKMAETGTTRQDRALHRLVLAHEAESRGNLVLAAWHYKQALRLDPGAAGEASAPGWSRRTSPTRSR